MKERQSQNVSILRYLKTGKGITSLTALHMFNCLRLSGRIYELRQQGQEIVTSMVKIRGKHVAAYWLAGIK